MGRYLALLRGINVGGNAKVGMAELREHLAAGGLENIVTYIQSGNVVFSSNINDQAKLENLIASVIKKNFGVDTTVAVLSKAEWQAVVDQAPEWWGKDTVDWKHNLLVLLRPTNTQEVIEAIGALKPGIERVQAGPGVIYQSLSIKLFGRTTSGKLASNPVYKNMTIRNYNTTQKLLELLGN